MKLVVFDLDDTLWRGVAAESDDLGWEMVEGWPLGMVEAVAALHGRGVLVALVSKNDEARAEQVWRHLYQHHFPWESFFAHEISWGDKAEAIGRIIRKANILPSAALFVDDNPIERERAKGALPDLRILDAPVAEWKRILLWSPQTQPAVLTEEARSRSRSLNARPAAPAAAESREAFLERLNVQVSIETVDSMEAPAFKRVFELLNKTNQFNTTGRRWKLPEARALFDAGGMMLTARVSDAYSDYGLTAIAVVSGPEIVQMVMSCRVFGLGVEGRLLQTALVAIAASGAGEAFGAITPNGSQRLQPQAVRGRRLRHRPAGAGRGGCGGAGDDDVAHRPARGGRGADHLAAGVTAPGGRSPCGVASGCRSSPTRRRRPPSAPGSRPLEYSVERASKKFACSTPESRLCSQGSGFSLTP